MTIASTINKTICLGNGATTAFSYSFLIPIASDVVVTFTDASGNQTVLAPTQYTISGLGNGNGGTINYPLSGSPMSAGQSITLQRILPYQQLRCRFSRLRLVSDANATTFNSIVAGGGANTVPVFVDGASNWRIG